MGAEVLGQALMKLGVSELGVAQQDKPIRPMFKAIVFAAPDVSSRIFREVIEPAITTNHSMTTYGTPADFPLWFSAIENQRPRAGSVAANDWLPACVDTIDVSAVTERGLNHSTWAESSRVLDDLRFTLRDGLEPSERGLSKRRMGKRTIWILPGVAAANTKAATQRKSSAPKTCVIW
jgi:esterase/lipase superfamily enzyme